MIRFKRNQGRAKRFLVLIGFAALLLAPLGAPSAGDGGGGPPIPYDSTGKFDIDTVRTDSAQPSFR